MTYFSLSSSHDKSRLLSPPDQAGMVELLKTIDDRQRNGGDYKALAYIEQKKKTKI